MIHTDPDVECNRMGALYYRPMCARYCLFHSLILKTSHVGQSTVNHELSNKLITSAWLYANTCQNLQNYSQSVRKLKAGG